jgi:DNA-binding response OmpR family regulator
VKILLVEDDELIGSMLFEALVAHRYTVDVAADGQAGLELATNFDYDLILLDWLIPKLDGISLCRQLRSNGYQKPILLLTAKDSNSDIVQGLDAGADDYIVKPYDLSALMARIRALLRRGNSPVTSVLNWGNLCLNPVSGEVTCGEQLLSLTPKEYSLLELFLRNPQRVFSRSAIIDRLWSLDGSPAESAVTVHIKELRQKLKTGGMTEEIIETVYGLGYRLKSPPEEKVLVARERCGTRKHPSGNGKGRQGGQGRKEPVEIKKSSFTQQGVRAVQRFFCTAGYRAGASKDSTSRRQSQRRSAAECRAGSPQASGWIGNVWLSGRLESSTGDRRYADG